MSRLLHLTAGDIAWCVVSLRPTTSRLSITPEPIRSGHCMIISILILSHASLHYYHPSQHHTRSKDAQFLSDFALLLSAPRLILSSSTFSDWAGLLGKATEVHTPYLTKTNGGPPSRNWAPVWSADHRYIYHDPFEDSGRWFGRYNASSGRVEFAREPLKENKDYSTTQERVDEKITGRNESTSSAFNSGISNTSSTNSSFGVEQHLQTRNSSYYVLLNR